MLFQNILIFFFLCLLQLILKEVDSLLYVDTDIIFLQPVEHMWALLSNFNSSQLAAMAPEHEEPRIGWYNRFARHPYYGKTGINSGVMLMNMTRLRENFFKVKINLLLINQYQYNGYTALCHDICESVSGIKKGLFIIYIYGL